MINGQNNILWSRCIGQIFYFYSLLKRQTGIIRPNSQRITWINYSECDCTKQKCNERECKVKWTGKKTKD